MLYRLLTPMPVLHADKGGTTPCANYIDENTTGWRVNADSTTGHLFLTDRIHYLEDHDKYVFYGRWTGAGNKYWHQIILVDAATWTIDWTFIGTDFPNPTPLDPDPIFDGTTYYFWNRNCVAYGDWIILVWEHDYMPHVLAINAKDYTWKKYHFDAHGDSAKNVDYTWSIGTEFLVEDITPFVDGNTLYLCRHGSDTTNTWYEVITTDLTALPDETGFYTFSLLGARPLPNLAEDSSESFVGYYPDENRIIIASKQVTSSGFEGHIWLIRFDTGAIVKQYYPTKDSDMWHWGVHNRPVIYDDKIYAPINYSSNLGQGDKRGIMRIDTDDDSIDFIRPDYASFDNYALRDAQLIDDYYISGTAKNTILFCCDHTDPNGGVALYHIKSDTWEYWNSTNVECFVDADQVTCVGYDSKRGRIICSNSVYDVSNQVTRERVVYF